MPMQTFKYLSCLHVPSVKRKTATENKQTTDIHNTFKVLIEHLLTIKLCKSAKEHVLVFECFLHTKYRSWNATKVHLFQHKFCCLSMFHEKRETCPSHILTMENLCLGSQVWCTWPTLADIGLVHQWSHQILLLSFCCVFWCMRVHCQKPKFLLSVNDSPCKHQANEKQFLYTGYTAYIWTYLCQQCHHKNSENVFLCTLVYTEPPVFQHLHWPSQLSEQFARTRVHVVDHMKLTFTDVSMRHKIQLLSDTVSLSQI